MIEFQNVCKMLGGRTILDDLSFKIEKGETFVIVGPSGVGKSVTLKHMVRLLTPDTGDVIVDGHSVVDADPDQLSTLREYFGYLFQGGALLAWMDVEENVALPLIEKTNATPEEIDVRVQKTLALVGLENDGEKAPGEISGGMRKRAGLARAIIHEPQIVLYDEPTSGLDPVSARTIDRLIDSLREKLGVTSVVVTHDLHSALAIGTRIAMLHGGRFVEIATPEAFVKSDNEIVRGFLDAQFISKKGSWEGTSA
ncbi:MAG: ATP-binding cassette domain-containing protein [Verrucomicrobia bacterium]|nr:ATP-binding cassette domain-containing protein [Verrucomicrobiota bacterium]